GDLGTLLITNDGGKTWQIQPNVTGKALQTLAFRGGSDVWVGGRGGAILKRSQPLTPFRFAVGGGGPPVLRPASGIRKPRIPTLTIPDDGDIPAASPPVKP
ncbi:MAG: hypothetical protein HOP17_00145, partial [Acidobacteria bacterium]|nr:hypothetical protein [Acidobacteriota bacterium]